MITLPPVNLSAAMVGSTGYVDFTSAGPDANPAYINKPPSVMLYNESGCGLQVTFKLSQTSIFVPAGAWKSAVIIPGEIGYNWAVIYLLPSAPVTTLLTEYYYPGENLASAVLGNSPVGIGGSVTTSGSGGTTFIKNDGNAPATSIIEATPSDQGASSWSFNNDASGFLRVLSANNLRNILQVVRGNNTTGKAVISVGDSSDYSITTFYGTLGSSVNVPASQITGSVPNATNAGQATYATSINGPISTYANSAYNVDGLATETPGGAARAFLFQSWDGTSQHNAFSVGSGFTGGAANLDDSGNATMNQIKLLRHGAGVYLSGINTFSGTGPGTVTHGGSSPPNFVGVNSNVLNSTYTVGVDSIGSSTFHVNIAGGVAWVAVAIWCN